MRFDGIKAFLDEVEKNSLKQVDAYFKEQKTTTKKTRDESISSMTKELKKQRK